MFFHPSTSIPRVFVTGENGQVVCYLDTKLKRFGPVLYHNNKQGRHLFSIGYCIASMAARFTFMPDKTAVSKIVEIFHREFLTILLINSRYSNDPTNFLKNWMKNYDQLVEEYGELKSFLNNEIDLQILQNYLNLVCALMHVLPCNVYFSHNASDPRGGINARKAIDNLRHFHQSGGYHHTDLNRNIALTVDGGVIKEVYAHGFDDNNIILLAYIIMQIWELQNLDNLERQHFLISEMMRNRMEDDLYEIIFRPHCGLTKNSEYIQAVSKAFKLIESAMWEVDGFLNTEDHKGIRNRITQGLDDVFFGGSMEGASSQLQF